ncbi:hypothetical protein A0H81_13676 [Grifola frondosa]|uniref:Uncharacterized protein n=1 Tax=Grifola frondosa TaxID=5627 RepID=A0A1C7LUA2_GRIFR|nr:hypothetical protein A0H81_13676 [Grifola frondosa]
MRSLRAIVKQLTGGSRGAEYLEGVYIKMGFRPSLVQTFYGDRFIQESSTRQAKTRAVYSNLQISKQQHSMHGRPSSGPITPNSFLSMRMYQEYNARDSLDPVSARIQPFFLDTARTPTCRFLPCCAVYPR